MQSLPQTDKLISVFWSILSFDIFSDMKIIRQTHRKHNSAKVLFPLFMNIHLYHHSINMNSNVKSI